MTDERVQKAVDDIRKVNWEPLCDAFRKLAQACTETIKAFKDVWNSPSAEQARHTVQMLGEALNKGLEQGIKDAQKRKPLELLHQYDPKKKKKTYRCKYKTISMLEKEWRKWTVNKSFKKQQKL